MYYIVDRIEEDCIVLEDEDRNMTTVSKMKFNFEVKEGDVVTFDELGNIASDEQITQNRKKLIEEKIIDLWM